MNKAESSKIDDIIDIFFEPGLIKQDDALIEVFNSLDSSEVYQGKPNSSEVCVVKDSEVSKKVLEELLEASSETTQEILSSLRGPV